MATRSRKRRKNGGGGWWAAASGALVLVVLVTVALGTQEKGSAKGAAKAAPRTTDSVASAVQRMLSSANGWCADSIAIDRSGVRSPVFAPCASMDSLKLAVSAGLRAAVPDSVPVESYRDAPRVPSWLTLALASLGAILGVFNLLYHAPWSRSRPSPRPVMGGPTRGGSGGGGSPPPIIIGGQSKGRAAPAPADSSASRAASGDQSRELEVLRRQHEQLEQKMEAVLQQLRSAGAAAALTSTPPRGQPAAPPLYSTPSDLMTPPGGFPSAGEAAAGSAGEFLGGALSADDDRVHLRQSSRPMLEIRWRSGAAEAAVSVNPEFRFGDLNAALLAAAFDVDGAGGAGRYETVVPARVEWGQGATAGRVKARGRVRSLGA